MLAQSNSNTANNNDNCTGGSKNAHYNSVNGYKTETYTASTIDKTATYTASTRIVAAVEAVEEFKGTPKI